MSDQAEGRGSEMVKDDRPQPELKPDGDLARAVDQAAFEGRWANEQEAAKRAVLERYEQQLQRDSGDYENEISI